MEISRATRLDVVANAALVNLTPPSYHAAYAADAEAPLSAEAVPAAPARYIGIVGAEGAKFTPTSEAEARAIIRGLLAEPGMILVSGGCHLGGIDIWAEEEADALSRMKRIFKPASRSWEGGYKLRNIQIAETSDVVHNIVVRELPMSYRGMRFASCYHCHSTAHVKSGGCWTARYAERECGKAAFWHIVG